MTRLAAARTLFVLAGIAALLSAWAFFTGGFRVRVLDVPLSVRGADRAAAIAIALASVGVFLHTGVRRRIAALRLLLPPLPRLLFPAALLAAAAVLWAGLTLGSRAAGGSDPYGYVSQAELWRRGDLRIHQPFVASIPWPNAEWTFSPLGYKPSDNHTIVPTYSPGYPLLMALFWAIFGANGPYFVSPLCGAALVLLTYALGVRLSGPLVGTIGALCTATSATVLFLTLSAMSDIPVAAFWCASILVAIRLSAPAAFLSAVLAGIAIVIRPNLVLAAGVPLLIVAWPWPERSFTSSLKRAFVFTLAFAPFALFVGWLFNELYGSPLQSGYGGNDALFNLAHVGPNLGNYPRWLWQTQGPLTFLFLLSPFVARGTTSHPPLRWLFAGFVGVITVAYLVYLPFDDWWYLRFLLPVFPFVFILAADTVWTGTARLGEDRRNVATVLFTVAMIYYGASNAWQRDVLAIGRGEQKYVEVGQHLDRTLPRNAVVYSLQHSGSVRYYTGRLTLRYDYLEPEWLDRSIDFLQRAGYEPFFLLDDWEVPLFRERFASQKYGALVATEPKHRPCTHTSFVYRVVPRPGEPASFRIPQTRGCE